MRRYSILIFILFVLLGSSSNTPYMTSAYSWDYENVLGTSLTIKVNSNSGKSALKARDEALLEIDRLNAILSSYDETSEFRQWLNTLNTEVVISPELFEVMTLFEHWREKTDGAVNASAAIASQLWKEAEADNELPDSNELQGAVSGMNGRHWLLDKENMTATRLTEDPLVLNSFVKSYIIEKTSDRLMEVPGIISSVVNIGGDMLVAGELSEVINVADPLADGENENPVSIIECDDLAVATSGNYRRGFSVEDKWFSHIIDPRTAMPADKVVSATVVAPSATDAGALATAFNILNPEESQNLAQQIPGTEFLIVKNNGEQIKSRGWDVLESKYGNNILPGNENSELDNSIPAPEYVLNIEFELTRFQGRSLRPYVAVWIENDKAEPVRTLALWFNNYRWLPDLKRWYNTHLDKIQMPEYMQSITSATRPAGKYTLTWDGKDEDGRQQKNGKYTIYIEVSREHGTYQLVRKEIELNKKAQRIELPGGTEIASAALDYRKPEKNKTSIIEP